MIKILSYIWQLPQNIIGAVYRDLLSIDGNVYELNITPDYTVYSKQTNGNFTLGRYIFISPDATTDDIAEQVKFNELSRRYGPFYFIVLLLQMRSNKQ